MTAMWCEKKKGKGKRIHLQICISCDCKLRDTCPSYAAIDAASEAQAIADVQSHGHRITVSSMPLLERAA